MICPCKGCPDQGCGDRHDACEAYQAYTTERQEINRKNREDTDNRQLSREQTRKHWKNIKLGRTVSMR